MKDHCTWFPEYWWTWTFSKIYIGDMCKKHDNENEDGTFDTCANTQFYKNTWRARLIGAVLIATIASIACFIKNTKNEVKGI